MAVAVDDDGHAGSDGCARMLSVHVQMSRCTIDLERCAGSDRGFIDGVEVERIGGPSSDDLVARVGDDRDERMTNGTEATASQSPGVVAGVLVQRCEHDVECRQNVVWEIETAVGHDVY